MTDRPRRAIAWFRRDLRLGDSRMLAEATRADRVWPVFVADPSILATHAAARGRIAWFAAGLAALDAELAAHGSRLTVLAGEPARALTAFAREVGAEVVVAARDAEPDAMTRDRAVADVLPLELVDDTGLIRPGSLRTATGDPYRVFTPFRRALDHRLATDGAGWIATAVARLDRLAPGDPTGPSVERFPMARPPHELPPAGEAHARGRLQAFLRHAMRRYAAERDQPARDATSHLSPDLRVGAISIRAAWRAAIAAEERGQERDDPELRHGARRWRDELAWREFYASVLAVEPRVLRESHRPEFDALEWTDGREADELLAAWADGRTGVPIVDAGMRQLRATGWMHNRLRLITASYLVKDLGVDWRRGEAVFMAHLLDGDVAQNNGNWQWVAGVGTDAAPYFRVLNPTLQAQRFDPDGAFIRHWVPELAALPVADVHEPWRASTPPAGYPAPLVDHADARRRTLARYGRIRADRGQR
jgi:deoxyribodipyrimidine photo-lyase